MDLNEAYHDPSTVYRLNKALNSRRAVERYAYSYNLPIYAICYLAQARPRLVRGEITILEAEARNE